MMQPSPSLLLQAACNRLGFVYAEIWRPRASANGTMLILHATSANEDDQDDPMRAFASESRRISLAAGSGLPGRVWATRQPEWSIDVRETPANRFVRVSIAKTSGLAAAVGIPLLSPSDSAFVGVAVFFAQQRAQSTVQIMQALGNVGAMLAYHLTGLAAQQQQQQQQSGAVVQQAAAQAAAQQQAAQQQAAQQQAAQQQAASLRGMQVGSSDDMAALRANGSAATHAAGGGHGSYSMAPPNAVSAVGQGGGSSGGANGGQPSAEQEMVVLTEFAGTISRLVQMGLLQAGRDGPAQALEQMAMQLGQSLQMLMSKRGHTWRGVVTPGQQPQQPPQQQQQQQQQAGSHRASPLHLSDGLAASSEAQPAAAGAEAPPGGGSKAAADSTAAAAAAAGMAEGGAVVEFSPACAEPPSDGGGGSEAAAAAGTAGSGDDGAPADVKYRPGAEAGDGGDAVGGGASNTQGGDATATAPPAPPGAPAAGAGAGAPASNTAGAAPGAAAPSASRELVSTRFSGSAGPSTVRTSPLFKHVAARSPMFRPHGLHDADDMALLEIDLASLVDFVESNDVEPFDASATTGHNAAFGSMLQKTLETSSQHPRYTHNWQGLPQSYLGASGTNGAGASGANANEHDDAGWRHDAAMGDGAKTDSSEQQAADDSNPGSPAKQTRRMRKGKELSFADVSRHFDVPLTQAAERLNVCVTLVKRVCRENGVSRWPYRKLQSRKKKERIAREALTHTHHGGGSGGHLQPGQACMLNGAVGPFSVPVFMPAQTAPVMQAAWMQASASGGPAWPGPHSLHHQWPVQQ